MSMLWLFHLQTLRMPASAFVIETIPSVGRPTVNFGSAVKFIEFFERFASGFDHIEVLPNGADRCLSLMEGYDNVVSDEPDLV